MPNDATALRDTKLGKLLHDRGISLRQFAEDVYNKTGYFIATQNLSSYCTGYKKLTRIEIARHFAATLGVDIDDII
jgi:hypothetical protein